MNEGLLISTIKAVIVFGALMGSVPLAVWAERRVVAFMQQRLGPNRVGPFGILQGLADGVKLFFKEDIRPTNVDRGTYIAAPMMSVIPAFLSAAVIPFGPDITIGGRVVSMQLAELNVGVLFFLAMGSMMVYGVTLAGWSSGSVYPLLGGVRSAAQMISYEMALGLSVVAVVMQSGTLSTSGIVDAQAGSFLGVLPAWNIFTQLPAFLIFCVAGLAETNRAPFDLAEAESELVGGFHTEYSSIKFAMFMLAEYLHVITTSAIAVTLFLGGWRGPTLPFLTPLWPLVWFGLKLGFMVFLFMWVRASLPRVRYDILMRYGWKTLLPASLGWVAITAVLLVLSSELDRPTLASVLGLIAALVILGRAALVTWRRFGTLGPLALMRKVRHGVQ
ncbi:MAG: NADH-quinone oxidoreductase subunit NuoH [Actinomycetota bacterium]